MLGPGRTSSARSSLASWGRTPRHIARGQLAAASRSWWGSTVPCRSSRSKCRYYGTTAYEAPLSSFGALSVTPLFRDVQLLRLHGDGGLPTLPHHARFRCCNNFVEE